MSATKEADKDLTKVERRDGMVFRCLECDAEIQIPADAIKGEIVSCRDCGTSFEMVGQRENGELLVRRAETPDEDWGE